jgi:hypothetical protein
MRHFVFGDGLFAGSTKVLLVVDPARGDMFFVAVRNDRLVPVLAGKRWNIGHAAPYGYLRVLFRPTETEIKPD